MEQIKIGNLFDRQIIEPGIVQTAYLMVTLTGPKQEGGARPVQNLSMVIDRSGSMSGQKLEYTKKAAAFAVGHLGQDDVCSVVTFDEEVKVAYPAQKLENKDLLKREIQQIRSGGSTNLSGGMLVGWTEVKKCAAQDQINRILLLTDGKANVGITDQGALVKKVKEIVESGIQVSTFGLGENFEEDLLQAMADAGNGNFYYIETPDQIPGIFGQELTGLLSTVAQNITLKIVPAPGVKVTGILGYPLADGDEIKVNLPDLYSEETKVILFELRLPPLPEGIHHLFGIELSYVDVREALELVTIKTNVKLGCGIVVAGLPNENVEVIKQVELFRVAEAKEEAIRLADRGDYEGSRHILEKKVESLSVLYSENDDGDISYEILELKKAINHLKESGFDKVWRKGMSAQAYQQRKGRGGKRDDN